jgi:prepilin-type N-terminal cleavage/methylation domain-containing protein
MNSKKGFSLVELVVLIGIFGLLAALATPSFSRYIRSNRLANSTERMAADMQMVRTMSIANGHIFRMTTTPNGYQIVDLVTGDVVRNRVFEGNVQLAVPAVVHFFPWGMADASVFNLQNSTGARVINLLPTGIVEVQ